MADVDGYHTFDDPSVPILANKKRFAQLYCTVFLLALVCAGLAAALVLVLILQSTQQQHEMVGKDPYSVSVIRNEQLANQVRDQLQKNVVPDNIKNHLRRLAATVHVAGTVENQVVGDYLVDQYRSFGYDVTQSEYDVMVTYPDYEQPNMVYAINEDGSNKTVISEGKGTRLGPTEALVQMGDFKAPVWWNAYAKDGTVTAPIVYVNYCKAQDFETVISLGVQVEGAIVLCRYGSGWRGNKVLESAKHGALGTIIYSDPADYARESSTGQLGVYPDSIEMPPSGAQRGSTKMGDGDPATPFYPAKPYVYREFNESTLRDSMSLPSIPVTPVGYGVAQKIFELMDGVQAPKKFIGNLPLTYRLNGSQQFQLVVHSRTDAKRRIRNVCATLPGKEEPDALVLLSNHYDAWTNGAIDPNSGTAVMLEAARVLKQVVNTTGWKPRRSIVLCNWDGEEYGLLGSNEWMEEHEKKLYARAVALINCDSAVDGNQTLSPEGTPSMFKVLADSAKLVSNPNLNEMAAGRGKMYDSWAYYFNRNSSLKGLDPPIMKYPGSGSDHYSFMAYAGLPIVSFSYACAVSCENLYHTMYEVPWTVENLYDRGFRVHASVTQLLLEISRRFSDDLLVPLDLGTYGAFVRAEMNSLLDYMSSMGLEQSIASYMNIKNNLTNAANRLITAISKLQSAAVQPISIKQLTMINNRLTQFERSWIAPRGLCKGRESTRHVLLSASQDDQYQGQAMAGVRDAINRYIQAKAANDTASADGWLAQSQLSITQLQYAIESAIDQLQLSYYAQPVQTEL